MHWGSCCNLFLHVLRSFLSRLIGLLHKVFYHIGSFVASSLPPLIIAISTPFKLTQSNRFRINRNNESRQRAQRNHRSCLRFFPPLDASGANSGLRRSCSIERESIPADCKWDALRVRFGCAAGRYCGKRTRESRPLHIPEPSTSELPVRRVQYIKAN